MPGHMDVKTGDLASLAERLARGEAVDLLDNGRLIGRVFPPADTPGPKRQPSSLPFGIWKDRLHLHEPADAPLPADVVEAMERWPEDGRR